MIKTTSDDDIYIKNVFYKNLFFMKKIIKFKYEKDSTSSKKNNK
jgi:hypothetical protein